ncbi:protein-tyrosine phosphatase-like protein [Pisolithus sp. B1]|nr:protein-tyrosine phosphatase-like protein [Pisolithus sp. B1]
MIRFEGMAPEVMEAMCTPMHLILPAHYPSPTSPTVPSVKPASSTVAPGSLFLGSMSATMDRELLAANHITHVVQVLDVPWLPISEKDGFRCLKIDIVDKPSADLRPHLEGACEYIASALHAGGNVLVHCQQVFAKINAAIVIAYLIHNLGMSYDQAHALVKRRRPCINPNPGFVSALRAWENRWRSNAPSPPPQFRRASTSYAGMSTVEPTSTLTLVPNGHAPQVMRGISYGNNGGSRPY